MTPGEARVEADQVGMRKRAELVRCPRCRRMTGVMHGRMAKHKLPPNYTQRCPGSRLHVAADGTVIEDPKAAEPEIRRDRRNDDSWRVEYLRALAAMPRSRALYIDANQAAVIWPLVMADPAAATEWQAIDRADHWGAFTSSLGAVLRGNVAVIAGTCNTSPADVGRHGNGGGKLQGMLAGESTPAGWLASWFWGRTRIRYSNEDFKKQAGVRLWRTEAEPDEAQTWVPPQRGYAHCERVYTAHCVESAEMVAAAVQRSWYKSPRLKAVRAALARVVDKVARSWFAAASALWGPKRTYWSAIRRSDKDRTDQRKASERESTKRAESARALKTATELGRKKIIANASIPSERKNKSCSDPAESATSPPVDRGGGAVRPYGGAGPVPHGSYVGPERSPGAAIGAGHKGDLPSEGTQKLCLVPSVQQRQERLRATQLALPWLAE